MSDKELNILLVEDSINDIAFTKGLLKKYSIAINLQVVTTGEECLNYLRNQKPFDDPVKFPPPDAVILDIYLPGISGLNVLLDIKRDPQLQNIPVIMLTASQFDEDKVSSMDMGAFAHIHKPIDLSEFDKVIQDLLKVDDKKN